MHVVVKDPHFTLARHQVSSSSVVRTSDLIRESHGFEPHLELAFFRVSMWCKNVSCCCSSAKRLASWLH